MSEVNETTQTPEELVKRVRFGVRAANVIPMPIDPTLSNEGEAADAKATGDAIAGILDNLRVNGKSATASGLLKLITIYAGDILMSSEQGAQTIAEAISAASSIDASNVMYNTQELISVKTALDDIYQQIDSELSEAAIDAIIDEVFGEEEEE